MNMAILIVDIEIHMCLAFFMHVNVLKDAILFEFLCTKKNV